MKHDMNEWNLRNAFPPEPDSCRDALMFAARSVKEEEPVKKITFRAVLIAALIIIAMMAVAVAATYGSLTDWFQRHYNAILPQAAQEILSSSEKSTLDAGPVTFTINELLCDGKIVYQVTEAQLKEPGFAILMPDSSDPYDSIGEAQAAQLNHPKVTASTSYVDAAMQTGLPLYNVSSWLELEESPIGLIDCEMMDGFTAENGNQALVRMTYFLEKYEAESLPVEIVARVMELDLSTLDYVRDGQYRATEKRSIPIHGVMAEKQYLPEKSVVLSDRYTLSSVIARQTCAGIYVSICAKTPSPITLNDLLEANFEWTVLDDQGGRYPTGLSLTGEILNGNGERFPHDTAPEDVVFSSMQYMLMISADELPERLIVTDGSVQAVVE